MTAYARRHLLGIEGLSPLEISYLLDQSDRFVDVSRGPDRKLAAIGIKVASV